MPDAEQTISGQSDQDMVHFIQFNDTTTTRSADSIASTAMSLNLNADLHLREGATVNVDLSSNGNNRVQVMPSGDLDFSMSPLNGSRLTGRVNINSGFVRYTPPLMSEKNFAFKDGSYIAFNGDMMNPVLNIQAVDVVRANVTQDGQNSRVVNFDVMLSITNTFDNMNVAFDLSTNDDITVQNELTSMSAEQRANQAMNLLLYNVYTGANTKGTSLSGNPLFSFLTSQLNTWAATTYAASTSRLASTSMTAPMRETLRLPPPTAIGCQRACLTIGSRLSSAATIPPMPIRTKTSRRTSSMTYHLNICSTPRGRCMSEYSATQVSRAFSRVKSRRQVSVSCSRKNSTPCGNCLASEETE